MTDTPTPDSDQFFDADDNPVSLDTLCSREPAWAANRIRVERAELTLEAAGHPEDGESSADDILRGLVEERDVALAHVEELQGAAADAQREFEQCCAEYSDEARKAGEERDAVRAELAQARERIAALGAEVEARCRIADNWASAHAHAESAVDAAIAERDAALSRVRELEAERALLRGVCTGNAKTITELGAMAAAQPKPRDESVPPPGHWEPAGADRWRTFGPDGATLCMVYPTYGASEVMYAITVDGCGAYSDPTTAMHMADRCIARVRLAAPPDEAATWREWAAELSQTKGDASDDALRLAVESCHHAPQSTLKSELGK